MDLDERTLLDIARHPGSYGTSMKALALDQLANTVEELHARLATIDRRAAQVRGGLKPYARPVEVVDFLLAQPD